MGNTQVRYLKRIDKALHQKDRKKERDSWARLFASYDKQKQGYITYSELCKFINDVFKTFPQDATDRPPSVDEVAQTAKLFETVLDVNHDGKVSFQEFTNGIHDIYTKFHIDKQTVVQIQVEYDRKKRKEEEQKELEERMYQTLKAHTDEVRTEKSPEAVRKFLIGSEFKGTIVQDGMKQEYQLVIKFASQEEGGIFNGYHVRNGKEQKVFGEYKVKIDWMLAELKYQDDVHVYEAKFSLKEDVPVLNGPCTNKEGAVTSAGAFSIKYQGRVQDEE
jgi:Ca2+-binding EF-hand superfamily protein